MSQTSAGISSDGTTTTSPSTSEISPIPHSPIEESDQVTLVSALPVDTIDAQTSVTYLPNNEASSNPTMVVITSPSFNSDLSSEQNETIDEINPSSLAFLQTKQHRANHRRNKSEPVRSLSIDDIPSTITTLDSSLPNATNDESSSLSNNSLNENKRKSSMKTPPSNTSPVISIKQITQDKSSSSTTSTRKKKPWYNPFLSTYRQRNEEFHKIFKDLPTEERLIVDYSCAWQKDILIQGRMYISQNYLCFYANILNWKTSLCLKFKDIVGITREKTAKLISNAIEVKTNKAEKYFFASFVTRDKTFELMIRIWKTTLIDQSISNQQLWTMIHESYGDDLDMITDEEDTVNKASLTSTPTKQEIKLNDKYDRITSSSLHSTSFQDEEGDFSSVSSRGEHQTDDEDMIPIGEEAKANTLIRQPQSNSFQQDMNTPSEIIDICYLSQCSCESHLATKLIDRTYSMSVERLFDCVFGANDFLVAYRAARRIKDFHASEWQMNEETGKRERVCTYKVDVTAVFGQTTVSSTEKQMIDSELSKSHYIIDTEVRNEGIKYADAFFVASRYCLVQTGRNKSHLKVTCEVRYVKSLMMIIKSFIEKNAMAALQDSFTDLKNRIDLSTSSVKRIDHESSHRTRTSSNSNVNEKEKVIKSQPVSNKKPSRKPQSNELTSSNNNLSINSQEEELIQNQTSKYSDVTLSVPLTSSRNTYLIPFCIITMLLLLIVNIFLCVKLNQIDQMTDRLVQSYPSWLNKYSYQQEDNEWSLLLKRQEEYYQTQLTGLHSALSSTHNALRNVTDALNQLSKLSSGSR